MHLLGFRFAPRIRDLGETKLFVPDMQQTYPALKPLIGGAINMMHVFFILNHYAICYFGLDFLAYSKHAGQHKFMRNGSAIC
jgi:TnpA family transposase